MGAILLNMGPHAAALGPLLERMLPGETFVAVPSPDVEVVATLAGGAEPVESVLGPNVRWVHVLGAGVDGVPLAAIGDRVLTCSRGASAVAIAEFVLAAMLAFEKRIPDTWITAPPERWNTTDTLGTLHGRCAGLVGVGAIGTEVARRALAFDMEVLAVRRTSGPAPLAGMTMIGTLTEMLGRADHVVVAAPATPATAHIIDAAALTACRPGVHLVNVARGSLVDQEALRDALDQGQVACASLDVAEPEPLPAGHWLYSHPRVRLTPHISWSSPDTGPRTLEMFVDNLRRYRAGEALHGRVAAAGY